MKAVHGNMRSWWGVAFIDEEENVEMAFEPSL